MEVRVSVAVGSPEDPLDTFMSAFCTRVKASSSAYSPPVAVMTLVVGVRLFLDGSAGRHSTSTSGST
jgi:hypothetical protein